MLPLAELEGDTGDKHMGLHARMMSQALRMINPIAAQNKCAVMFINQIRHKI
jgi:recombination protein RecA